MTGTQIFTVIVSFIIIYFASSMFDTWAKYKSEVGRIKNQQELNRIVDERLRLMIEAEEASLKATKTMSERIIELQNEVERLSIIVEDKLKVENSKNLDSDQKLK